MSQGEHEKLGRLAGTQIFSSSYKSAKRGVAVLLKNNLRFIKDRCIREKQGRFVFLQGEIDGQLVTLINVYDPPGEGVALMKRILCLLMSEAKGLTIMGGDLNLVMNQKIDITSRIKHKSEPSAKLLREAKLEVGLLDVWRYLNPKDRTFTFHSDAHKVSSRLDYFLC